MDTSGVYRSLSDRDNGFRMVQAGMMGEGAAAIAADSEKVMPIMVMTL
jgi:hypothetical protein